MDASLLHPADVMLFNKVAHAMRAVAKAYDLPLQSITPHPDGDYRTSPLGDCSSAGYIRLVMRGRLADGTWDDQPRREQEVWGTAAHELSHLRHMNHGVAFHEFEVEMQQALVNQQRDHREKLIERLVRMQASRDSEAKLGNLEAAESFAAAINKMLIEHELNPSDLDYARSNADDPVIELRVDFVKYGIAAKKSRIAWQETLARLVARAHLCSFLVSTRHNSITFVGTKSHATVAEYVYGTLVPLVLKMAEKDYNTFFYANYKGGKGDVTMVRGFRAAWLAAFLSRIAERFDEARKQAVATAAPGSSSTALVRLNGAMVKVQDYIDNKFHQKRRYANPLSQLNGSNDTGSRMGRAAADRLDIGRKAITTSSIQALRLR